MNARHRRAVQILGLSLAPALLVAVPAVAKSDFVREVTASSPDPLALAPGTSTERTVRVQNKYGANAALHLRATHVVDSENTCIRQEQGVEGAACVNDDAGELGDWLELTILKPAPGAADSMVLWSGMMAELEDGVELMTRVPAGGKPELRIVTTMLQEADNRTMTDRVTYDLEWTLTSTAGKQKSLLQMDTSAGGTGSPRSVDLIMSSARALGAWPVQTGLLALLALAVIPGHVLRWRSRHQSP